MRLALMPPYALNRLLPIWIVFLVSLSSTTGALAASESTSPELRTPMDPQQMRAGGLLLQRPDGFHPAPALETSVDLRVTGLIARTELTQRFRNPTEDWVEGIYVFPLPDNAAVDALHMRMGTRVIEGRIQERAQARATYKKAKREGRKASLVEQERPNLFTTSVAHLGPGEELEITLSYQQEVQYDQGRFSLRFPMTATPRYIPGVSRVAGFPGSGWATNTNAVPDAERITPPVLAPEHPRKNLVSIRARLDIGFRLERLESPSHPIRFEIGEDEAYEVVLEAGQVVADSDFVLSWTPVVGETPGAALFREEWDGAQYALLMVLPPNPEKTRRARLSRELIIVIDTSGSMSGESIVQARRAVENALARLQPEDAFNVIRFSSTTDSLFPDSRPATPDALREAEGWVARLDANGGTEMLPALTAALRPGALRRAVRQVIFVTDGAVGNEAALFAVIKKQLGDTRLYSVGIGSAPNSHFMTRAAQFGRGTFTFIGAPSQVQEKMNTLFSKLDHPVLHDLEVDWDADFVEAWPARIPDVYLGEPIVIAARLPATEGRVMLRGRRDHEEVRIDLGLGGGSQQSGVARLWARRKIAHLMDTLSEGADRNRVSTEVAALGIRHHLVTRWTSLVAVDITPTAPVDTKLRTSAVPGHLPKGADAARMLGRLPQGATPFPLLLCLGGGLLSIVGSFLALTHRKRNLAGHASAD